MSYRVFRFVNLAASAIGLLSGALLVCVISGTVVSGSDPVRVDDQKLHTGSQSGLPLPRVFTYKIANAYPHDPHAFTQGLVFNNGFLYEGTGGRYGLSTIRQVEFETGRVIRSRPLGSRYFGEGITIFNGRLIQLTWKSKIGFVYDLDNFELLRTFSYQSEGWGLTDDGERLIMSDGTSTLYFIDPVTFERIGHVTVYDEKGPVNRLNELEYIGGEVYANVLQTDLVARIDPRIGRVTAWIDLAGLLEKGNRSSLDVLNGIAYDANNNRLFVTGKRWPRLFEIVLVEHGK